MTSTVEKQGERPKQVAIGQRWKLGPLQREKTVTGRSGNTLFVCKQGDVDSDDGHVHNGACCWWHLSWFLYDTATFLGYAPGYAPPSPVPGSVPRPAPAAGQRWRACGSNKYNHCEPFTLSHFDGTYWRMEGDCGGGWAPETFAAGKLLEYVDTPSTPIAPEAPAPAPKPAPVMAKPHGFDGGPYDGRRFVAERQTIEGAALSALEAVPSRKPPEPWRPSVTDEDLLPDAPGTFRSWR